MKIVLVICICIIAGVVYGCQNSSDVPSLSVDKFAELIADERVQVVDVRTAAEYSDNHIPGAININVMDEQFNSAAQQILSADMPVAVYCKSGRRSKKAAKELIKAGYKVYDLDNGIEGWKKAGKPIVKN